MMLYSGTHMETVGVKGLIVAWTLLAGSRFSASVKRVEENMSFF